MRMERVFPWRAQRATHGAERLGFRGNSAWVAREHAFGEDRGAGAKRRARELGHLESHASWGIKRASPCAQMGEVDSGRRSPSRCMNVAIRHR